MNEEKKHYKIVIDKVSIIKELSHTEMTKEAQRLERKGFKFIIEQIKKPKEIKQVQITPRKIEGEINIKMLVTTNDGQQSKKEFYTCQQAIDMLIGVRKILDKLKRVKTAPILKPVK